MPHGHHPGRRLLRCRRVLARRRRYPRVDVHRCTSATCLVCHGSATTFVHVFEDEGAAAPEGYECGDERHGASAHSSFARTSRNEGPCESSGMRARALLWCLHIFIN